MKTDPKHNITSVDDLLAAMRQGVQATYEISCRGLTVPVRVLSADEFNQVRRDAEQHKARIMGDETDKNLHTQKVILKLASTLTPGGGPLLSDRFWAAAQVDEINHLYNEYVRVLDVVNPSLEKISHEDFRQLVDGLKKNTITERDLSLRQLRAICIAFVDLTQQLEARASQQANSSGGPRSE